MQRRPARRAGDSSSAAVSAAAAAAAARSGGRGRGHGPLVVLSSKLLLGLGAGLLVLALLFGRAGDLPADGDDGPLEPASTASSFGAAPQTTSSEGSAGAFVIGAYVPDYRLDHVTANLATVADVLTDMLLFSGTVDGVKVNVDLLGEARLREAVFQARRHGVQRILLTVGGAGRSQGFPALASDPNRCARFANNAAETVEVFGLDGMDLDWEAPTSKDEVANYVHLLEAVSKVFKKRGLLLSVTTHFFDALGPPAYAAVDRVMLMAYDLGARHSAQVDVERAVDMLVQHGLDPAGKLVVGIPAYARHAERPQDVKTFAELLRDFGSEIAEKDEHAGFVYTGRLAAARRASWARSRSFAGVFFWELGQDVLDDHTHSLVGALR